MRNARMAKQGLGGVEKASEIGTKSMYHKLSPAFNKIRKGWKGEE